MPFITPNTLGHYPPGYPIASGFGNNFSPYDAVQLETATDTPDLELFKVTIQDTLSSSFAQDYFSRNLYADEWYFSRWPDQTIDGRKWGDERRGLEPWPWKGASDTRVRTIESVVGQHRTLFTYGLRNMKWQAKSTKPASTIEESQQATTLLNWMLFSHMQAEMHRELRLAISWRNRNGAAILKTDWKQSRMMQYIDVNVMGLQEFVNAPEVQAFLGTSMGNIPLGENLDITDLQQMIMDPAYAQDLSVLLRSVSHDYLSLKQARSKLDDLRQLRTVEIPVPYVFESRPRITAYRPMVDVLFPTYADDLQSVPWYDCVEYVNAATLNDRIKTAEYDPAFVAQALEFRGPTSGQDWRIKVGEDRAGLAGIGTSSMDNDIELHHFYSLVHDRGVPARYHTVFHTMVDIPAKHGPDGYDHAEACIHPMRFEIDDRPIISSRGIAEIAYTWEQELKTQYDSWADRTSMTLRPPLMTTYDELQKMKDNIQPGVIFPMRNFDNARFMQMPPMDQVSVLITQEIKARIREHFAIFGTDLDPQLLQLRREEMTDDLLLELKPVCQQVMKLMKQLLPDADVAKVIGPLARPFHVEREDIQGEYDLTGTVDVRDMDNEWLKEKIPLMGQVAAMDTLGQIDKSELTTSAAEAISSDFADRIMKNPQAANNADIIAEQHACDLILGSGQDQPLGTNPGLCLQTMQAKQQSYQSNPATMKIIQNNPEVVKVLLNREKSYQLQLQQQQNAQIGRINATQTFNKQAPAAMAPPAAPTAQTPVGAPTGGGY